MDTGINTHEGTTVVNYVSPRAKEIEMKKLYADAVKAADELLASLDKDFADSLVEGAKAYLASKN